MILGLFRVLFGFIVACLVAAAVKVGFVVTPEELLAGTEKQWVSAGQLTLFVATQNFVFAAPFALLAAIIGEWQGVRGWSFYVLTGVAIAAAGFYALYSSENAGQPTIVNRYALLAYFCSGLAGGLIYWLFAGRFAGGNDDDDFLDDRTSPDYNQAKLKDVVLPGKPVLPKSGNAPGLTTVPPRPPSVPISKGN